MANAVIPVDIIRHSLGNGLGRYVCQLQRLTLKFCKEYRGSLGIRNYIEHHLLDFAKGNPGVVVYLLPQRHNRAYLVAEYINGKKEEICVDKMKDTDIVKWVELLRSRSGQPIHRIKKPWVTNNPSIQGVWSPDMDVPEVLNASSLPLAEFSK